MANKKSGSAAPKKQQVVVEDTTEETPAEEPQEAPVEEAPEEEFVEEAPVEEETEETEQAEPPQAQATDYSPYVFRQTAVLYTDGVSGVADHDQERAYDNKPVAASRHVDALDDEYPPHKDIIAAEHKRLQSYPQY